MKKKKSKTNNLFSPKLMDAVTKGTTEALLGAVLGTSISALTGKQSLLAGVILSIAGHYFDHDKMGILKMAGASAIGYGVAKRKEYAEKPTLSKRFDDLKNDWFGSFQKQWKENTENQEPTSNTTITRVSPDPSEKEQKKKTPREQGLKGKNTPKSKDAAPSKPEKKSSNESKKVETPEKPKESVQKNTEDTIKQKIQQAIILTIESDEDTEDALKKVGLTEEEVEQFLEKKAQEKGIDHEQVLYEITSEIKNYKEAMEYGNSADQDPETETDSTKQLNRAERRELQRNQQKVEA